MLMLVLVSECEEVDIEVKTAMAVKGREQTNGLVLKEDWDAVRGGMFSFFRMSFQGIVNC